MSWFRHRSVLALVRHQPGVGVLHESRELFAHRLCRQASSPCYAFAPIWEWIVAMLVNRVHRSTVSQFVRSCFKARALRFTFSPRFECLRVVISFANKTQVPTMKDTLGITRDIVGMWIAGGFAGKCSLVCVQ